MKSQKIERKKLDFNSDREINPDSVQLDIDRIKQKFGKDKSDDVILENYRTIVATRKFEIENFWKRTIFFWGTIGGAAIGYATLKTKTDNSDFPIFLVLLILFYNIIFSLSTRGSKYWQEHWEIIAREYEEALGFKIFGWKARLKIRDGNKGLFLNLPFRFSVSKLSMILSDITCFFWGGVLLYEYHQNKRICFNLFDENCNLFQDFYNVGFTAFFIIGSALIINHILFSRRKYYIAENEEESRTPLLMLYRRRFLEKKKIKNPKQSNV